jgi:hypothetical protein
MQNHTANDLEHLYSDGEISSQFHQLWQQDGWPADKYVELWLKAEEMVTAARNERVERSG